MLVVLLLNIFEFQNNIGKLSRLDLSNFPHKPALVERFDLIEDNGRIDVKMILIIFTQFNFVKRMG